VETNAYQASLKYYLLDGMTKRGLHADILPVNSKQNKEARIEGMVPYFSLGRIFFVTGKLTPQVESQLKQFPHGKLIDIIDSFSMHLKMTKREKVIRSKPQKELPDINSIDEAIKQILARDHDEGILGKHDRYDRIDSGMSTGLGIGMDVELAVKGLKT
jgi:hypothetical protein